MGKRLRYWREIGPTVAWWVLSPVTLYGILWAGFKVLGVLGLKNASASALSWLSWAVHDARVVTAALFLLLTLGVHEGGVRVWEALAAEVEEAEKKVAAGRLVVRPGGKRMLEFENDSAVDIYNARWEWVGEETPRTIDNGGFPIQCMPAHTIVSASYVSTWSNPPMSIKTLWQDANGEEHSQVWPRGVWRQ